MKPNKQLLSFSGKSFSIGTEKVYSKELKMKFRKKETDFTRDRKLPFENIITLILQKGVKSLQLRLNEFSMKLSDKLEIITASAYVQAKNKLSYELFMELDLDVVINRYYDLKENEYGYETWENYRILATDGSQLRLPEEKEVIKKYGTTKIKNPQGDQGEYCHGLLSVIYDPLNNLALNTILEKGKYSERALAIKNIINLEETTIKIKEKDLILYDRGYYSSFLFAIILSFNKDYVCRIQKNSCKEAKELFEKDCNINSKIIEIDVVNKEEEYEKKYGIKLDKKITKTIKVRFVRVVLSTGEIEVLATSLLDEEKYKNDLFGELYFQRWGIEVYYDLLKNRLLLENFTGKNVESVLQDLYSSIYLSNFETILTRPQNELLERKTKKKNLKNKQKVNKQVSFNIIKNKAIEIFLTKGDNDKLMKELIKVFNTGITQERVGRTSSRNNTTTNKSLQFNKRKKKSCF